MDGGAGTNEARHFGEIELVSGDRFDPMNPDPMKMGLHVMARALANNCRFGGQVPRFYSIAQHSVLVALLAPKDMRAQRCAILHDGDECFGLPDLPTPVKPNFPDYVRAQKQIGRAIDERHEISEEDHRRIKPADHQALLVEKVRLKDPRNMGYWDMYAGGQPLPDWIRIEPLDPEEAYDLILEAIEQVFVLGMPIDRNWIEGRKGFTLIEVENPSP